MTQETSIRLGQEPVVTYEFTINGGFLSFVIGLPPVIIHFERCDFSNKNHFFLGTSILGNPGEWRVDGQDQGPAPYAETLTSIFMAIADIVQETILGVNWSISYQQA